MKKNFLVLIMATIVFLIVKTQTTSKPKYQPDHMFQVCGKHLSGLLAFVCQSKYNTPIPTRYRRMRSISDTQSLNSGDTEAATDQQAETPEESKGIMNLILSREEARSLLLFRRRRSPGVYDECCKKACAYREIVNYCAPQ